MNVNLIATSKGILLGAFEDESEFQPIGKLQCHVDGHGAVIFGHISNALLLDAEQELFAPHPDETEWARFLRWCTAINKERHRVARDCVLATHTWNGGPITAFRVIMAPDDIDTPLAVAYELSCI